MSRDLRESLPPLRLRLRLRLPLCFCDLKYLCTDAKEYQVSNSRLKSLTSFALVIFSLNAFFDLLEDFIGSRYIFQCSVSITLSPVVGSDSLFLFRFPIARELLSYVIHGFRICRLSDGVPSPVMDHVHVFRRICVCTFFLARTHARTPLVFFCPSKWKCRNKQRAPCEDKNACNSLAKSSMFLCPDRSRASRYRLIRSIHSSLIFIEKTR